MGRERNTSTFGNFKTAKNLKNRKLRFKWYKKDCQADDASKKCSITPYKDFRSKSNFCSSSMFFKVILANGNKYNKQDLFSRLQMYLGIVTLEPICPNVEEADLSFYVDNETIAQALKNANFKIELADGWKLQIKVTTYKMPETDLDQNLKQKVERVVTKRYQAYSNTLDLSKFHMDPDFSEDSLFLPLAKTSVLLTVLQTITQNIPSIGKIILSHNKLKSVESLSVMAYFTKELKVLDLSYNEIQKLKNLLCLERFGLQKMNVEFNPLCEQYDDKNIYIRELRKYFPTLIIVDGVHFGPQYVRASSIDATTNFPNPQRMFVSSNAIPFVTEGIQKYYSVFDDNASRQGLVDAYAFEAQFSTSVYCSKSGANMQKFFKLSRNMLVVGRTRREILLYRGWTQILTALKELPTTVHDFDTLNIDLLSNSNDLVVITMSGMFQEKKSDDPCCEPYKYLRTFCRIFVMKQRENSFAITNDILTVSVLSQEKSEILKWSKLLEIPSTPSRGEIRAASVSNQLQQDDACKEQMIITLANQTGMNLKWSEKCLIETTWNFDNAIQAFNEINAKGSVPSDAFVK